MIQSVLNTIALKIGPVLKGVFIKIAAATKIDAATMSAVSRYLLATHARATLKSGAKTKLWQAATGIALLGVSSQTFAIGEFLKKQNADQLSTAMYMLFAIMGTLIATVCVQYWLTNKRKQKLQHALEEHQQTLNNLPNGLIHVDLNGKVIFANLAGASMLGRQHEKLINSDFSLNFDQDHVEHIEQSLTGENTQILARAKSSNLYLAISFGETVTQINGNSNAPYRMLTLDNQNTLQRALQKTTQEKVLSQRLISASELAQVHLDLEKDTYCHDKLFDNLLLLNQINKDDLVDGKTVTSNAKMSEADSIQGFISRIHNADKGDWSKAVDTARKAGSAKISLRMRLSTSNQSAVYVPLELDIIATDTNKLDLKSEAKGQSQSGQYAYSCLTILVRENNAIEDQKRKFDLVSHQQQALLNASTHAVYALDESGNILWSNSQFNQILRQVMPGAKSKNLFELCPFPEDIMQLHQKPSGVSTRSYNMEFELATSDNRLMWIKLNLSFYVSKDRLSEQSEFGMIGILQDISEITHTRKALEQEQERMARLLNLAPVAITTINGDDQIISANSVMLERLKYSDKELKKGNFYQLFSDPAEAGTAAKHLNQSGRLRDFHAKLKGKDNKIHPSELHVDLINKEKQEFLCWIADRSDEQFQQDKFESLLQHSSMPMAILANTGFTQLNKPACALFCVEDEYDLFGVSPYSARLNNGTETAKELERIIDEVKRSGKAKSMHWLHKVGDQELPCHATYVPMYKDQAFDSILCIWTDKRELQKADEARMEAINLRQAAEREILEKQKLLANSQDQLATKMRTLADTEQKLQTVQEDLNETQSEFTHLQQEHENVTNNLQQLKEQYSQSRVLLADAQRVNADLNTQLETSSQEVQDLNEQRQQIANALKQSEENYEAAQQALVESEENAKHLEGQKAEQAQKLDALVNQIDTMKNAVSAKDEQISQVSEQINTLQSQLVSSSSTTERLREQLINQRKASEEAEKQRRELEQTYQVAQAELRNKARHLSHLQSEMEKLEEMSNQEKGDMQAQQSALKQELENKLAQLQATQDALSEAQAHAEQEKQEKAVQQARLAEAENELADMEAKAIAKQQAMEEKERTRREQQKATQHKLWEELKAKQMKLQQTEQILSQAKQQTESEKAEKEQHQKVLAQLKAELSDIETRNAQQQAKMAESDQQWLKNKEELKQEVEAKRVQLQETKQALHDIQRQADKERLSRIEQEQKLEQLTIELADVETRANKQKEMLTGSDEQWRKHHAEIEEQKKQLQQALQQAESHNQALQNKLEGKLEALQNAETQVNLTQTGEKALQKDLELARSQAEDLQQKIAAQEQKEQQLHQQLLEQQQALESKESSISELQRKQKALSEELAAVQQEYNTSKETLSEQHSSHSDLSEQMSDLEQSLAHSKQQLADKEAALQAAQHELESSKSKLAEQENALLSAHKQELEEATQDQAQASSTRPDIENLPMPDKPAVWFDLLPYLQSQPNLESLPIELNQLLTELEDSIKQTENSIEGNDIRGILLSSKKLVKLAEKVNSDALSYLMKSIENDCNNGMADNVSIRWPATKQGLQKTLRVVYSHLH